MISVTSLIGVWNYNGELSVPEFSQFTKSDVLSLDCDHVEGFQILDKLETLYGFGGWHLRIRDTNL